MTAQLVGALRELAHAALAPLTAPVTRARALVTAHPGLALLVLALLVTAAVLAIRGDRLMALALIPLSVAWLVLNSPFEGPTILVLSWSHGVTMSDLVSVAGFGIAAWRLAPLLSPV